MRRMNIIGFALFVLGLYASRMRDGLARIIMMARYPSYKPGDVLRRDIEWAWTFHRVCRLLGAT